MRKKWLKNICILGMIIGTSISTLGSEIQDNKANNLLDISQTIEQKSIEVEEIIQEEQEIEEITQIENTQEIEETTQEEKVSEIEEAIDVSESVEESIEEEVLWEEIKLEDVEASNSERNIVAERIVIPLYEAIGHGNSGIDLSGLGVSINELKNEFINTIFKLGCIDSSITRGSVLYSRGNSMSVTLNESDGVRSLILYDNGYCQIQYTNINYMIQRYNTMQSVVSGIMEKVNKANSELEKELIIHDYLVLNGQYDYDNYLNGTIPKESYSAYGLLVNHTGVCNSYAYSMKYLLAKAGIECEVVSGTGNGGAHAWNIVKIDGNYYYVDATWDDPVPDVEGRIRYDYFNLSKDEMSKDHSWNTWEYPEANDSRYDVFREHLNSEYYDGAIFYAEVDYDYTVNFYVSSIIRYDLANQKERILAKVYGYVKQLTIDRQQKMIKYECYNRDSGSVSIYGEIPQKVKDFVSQIYTKVLNRQAGNEEIEYWGLQIYSQATSPSQMIATLIETDEFRNKELTDEQYLQLLYVTLFNRKMDAGGDYWLGELGKGSTRLYILAQLSQGEEFEKRCNEYNLVPGSINLEKNIDKKNQVTQFVYRFYNTCMGRCPDSEGLQYWVDALSEQHSSVKEVVYFFIHSEEITQKNLSNEAYLEILYKSFFGRESDNQGKAYWLNSLENGTYSKDDLLRQFVYSAEFNGICGQYNLKLE